jgi:uncharacterized membrane protein
MLDHFKAAWPIVKANLVGWIIFGLVAMILLSLGIGIFLMPNIHRTVRNAIERQEGPAIGDIFNFDYIGSDIAIILVFIVAVSIGYVLCIIPGIILAFGLFWMPFLAADNKFAAVDAAKASFAHAKGNFVSILVFLIIGSILNQIGAYACGIPALITVPLTLVAAWLFYSSERENILAAAEAAGIPTKP